MPDKKSTSTTSKSVADNGPGGADLGQASYRAEQAQDSVIIFAFGWHPTPGYTDFFEQSPIDIFPPQFIFHSIPPYGIVPQVLQPFAIWVMFGATEPIRTVTVHDADGAHEISVEQMSKTVAASKRATWVAGNVVRAGAGIFGRASTMATGEEGGGPTTMATGEETTAPTTMATGEEGGGGPTTMATGEEASATFGGPPITTLAVAEEAVFTTLGLGEEGDGGTATAATTLDIGEESQAFRVANTTLALGEEDPNPTTLAVGEENPTTQAVGEEGGPTTLALGEETTTVVRNSPFGNF